MRFLLLLLFKLLLLLLLLLTPLSSGCCLVPLEEFLLVGTANFPALLLLSESSLGRWSVGIPESRKLTLHDETSNNGM